MAAPPPRPRQAARAAAAAAGAAAKAPSPPKAPQPPPKRQKQVSAKRAAALACGQVQGVSSSSALASSGAGGGGGRGAGGGGGAAAERLALLRRKDREEEEAEDDVMMDDNATPPHEDGGEEEHAAHCSDFDGDGDEEGEAAGGAGEKGGVEGGSDGGSMTDENEDALEKNDGQAWQRQRQGREEGEQGGGVAGAGPGGGGGPNAPPPSGWAWPKEGEWIEVEVAEVCSTACHAALGLDLRPADQQTSRPADQQTRSSLLTAPPDLLLLYTLASTLPQPNLLAIYSPVRAPRMVPGLQEGREGEAEWIEARVVVMLVDGWFKAAIGGGAPRRFSLRLETSTQADQIRLLSRRKPHLLSSRARTLLRNRRPVRGLVPLAGGGQGLAPRRSHGCHAKVRACDGAAAASAAAEGPRRPLGWHAQEGRRRWWCGRRRVLGRREGVGGGGVHCARGCGCGCGGVQGQGRRRRWVGDVA